MEEAEVLNELIEILSNYTGVSKNKISKKTNLGNDLGLDGDDALEVLEVIRNKFNVNMNNLNFESYFFVESEIKLFKGLMNKLLNRSEKIKSEKRDISVSRLVRVCIDKKW